MSKTIQNEPKEKLQKLIWFNFPAFEFSCQAENVEDAQKLLQTFLTFSSKTK